VSSDNLVYMVNQIARNFAAQGEAQAIGATAQHILNFWDFRMKAAILATDPRALSPIAAAAIERLKLNAVEADSEGVANFGLG
jgi:formate dehydrogenase subunit delta